MFVRHFSLVKFYTGYCDKLCACWRPFCGRSFGSVLYMVMSGMKTSTVLWMSRRRLAEQ